MRILCLINYIIAVIFVVCYAYQFLYIPVSWIQRHLPGRTRKPERKIPDKEHALSSEIFQRSEVGSHRYAMLICARNEAAVIGDLIRSLLRQTYNTQQIMVFVMADNCDDETAKIAASCGAVVYQRRDFVHIGKGYALQALLGHIRMDFPEGFDGYFVFDADNVLAPDYIEQMDRTFSEGYDIVTGYRNSKNFGSSWISAGYALWFLRESRYLNYPRHLLGVSCAVSGTGFMFSREVAEEISGWPYHMLTEDLEFTADMITKGRRIAFCRDACLYDEQPICFGQSVRQRMRWAKGYLQVFLGYGKKLISGTLKGSFSCLDMAMNIMPAFILTALSLVLNLTIGIISAVRGDSVIIGLKSVGETFGHMYLMLLVLGGITAATEWRRIQAKTWQKLLYTMTFPAFMITYIPIAWAAVFMKVSWKPIHHTVSIGPAAELFGHTEGVRRRAA